MDIAQEGRTARVPADALTAAVTALRTRFGEALSENASVREQHGNTLSEVPNEPPDAVVFATSTEDVAAVVKVCAAHRVPVIAFGAGSSFEGHVNAPFGGISVDISRMKRVIAVRPEDLDATVEAGVTREELNQAARSVGLFFPIDPGAEATLGGMAATRASGTNAVRYGTMRDAVLSLTAVMPDGSVVKTGGRAKKSSAGYDLARLLIGSEGTLGIITELTLRLHGIPEAIAGGICPFPSVRAACDAVIATIQMGLPVARIELFDEVQARACREYSKIDLPDSPLLFLEFHGSETGVASQSETFAQIAEEFGGGPFTWATRPEERSRLWKARHDAYWANRALRPTAKGISTDVCVPISRLAECVEETKADAAAHNLLAPIVGHVGDGNFHVLPLIDMSDPAEVAAGRAFVDRLVARALACEGTSTGEHGIGESNQKYLRQEFAEPALAAMRALKRALDPDDIMNPGKVVPPP